ncbi:MAG: sulfite exporter TauE/SafE family protein [Deltaproteobacteria bacterium]|nr:sulfite exporter TauE/SafE family protein [Deltaproteobacteria bacterium]
MVVLGIGLVGGAVSGFLGIGGGIVTAPLLLYVPAALGLPPLSMHVVSGLTITQALFAGLLGAWLHGRQGTVDRKLAGVMSVVIFGASLAGAAASPLFTHKFLLGVFAALALTAAVLIFRPGRPNEEEGYRLGSFPVSGAVGIAAGVGVLGGLVGQGGSFLLIPALTGLLRVPLRVAMGSNLVIVFFASLAGFFGKAATGQIPFALAMALLAGVAPGSLLGIRWNHRAPVRALRLTLGGLILVACARMVWDLTG